MENWMRAYKITVTSSSGGFSTSDLRINFQVKKTEESCCNEGEIVLWNINEIHEKMITNADDNIEVELKAGYDNKVDTIFKGYVTYAETLQDGADRKTRMEVIDGSVENRDAYSCRTYYGRVSNETVLKDAASDMGVDIKFSDEAESSDDFFGWFEHGFSFNGKTTKMIQKACDLSDLDNYMDDNVLCIKKNGGALRNKVYVLSSSTGLVGWPIQMAEAGPSGYAKIITGYEVKYFLNPDIKVGEYVKLDSKRYGGQVLRVSALTMTGDNYQGDWLCSATLKIDTSAPMEA